MKVVLDTSCIIILSQIRQLDILEMFSEVFIPEGVFAEFTVKAAGGDDEKILRGKKWIKIVRARDTLAVKALQTDLGKGESECIVLAEEVNADFVVLDDKNARKTQNSLD